MDMRTGVLAAMISICLSLVGTGSAVAGEIDLQLIYRTGIERNDFGTGSHSAYTTIQAGDVYLSGTKIGDFTVTLTATTYTGANGLLMQYDLLIPGSGPIAEFLAARANQITTGSTSGHGIIYAASPAFKAAIGLEVVIAGNTFKILY